MMYNTQNTEKNKTEEAGKRFQPYESNPEKSSTPRERPGEGTRPYGSNPNNRLSPFAPLPRTVMRGNQARSHPQTASKRPG